MRHWMPLFAVLSLAGGCKHVDLQAEADDAKCRSYGLAKGTNEYAQCRVTLEAANRNAAATYSVGQAIQSPNIWQSTDPGWLHRPY